MAKNRSWISKFIVVKEAAIARGSAVSLLAVCRATLILRERERKGGPGGCELAAEEKSLVLPIPPWRKYPFCFFQRCRPFLRPSATFVSFVRGCAHTASSFDSCASTLFLSSSIRPYEQLLRRPGPCSWDNERTLETKSIDDAGRSSSFNPHRAHCNPLVYHVEIKSLPAVAKSIILWRARRKSRRLRSRGRARPKDAIVIAPTTNFGFPPIVQLFACVSVPADSRTLFSFPRNEELLAWYIWTVVTLQFKLNELIVVSWYICGSPSFQRVFNGT